MLLRLDFQDFFPAFPAARVHALFRTFGYPEAAADRGIAAKRSFLGLLGQATSGSGPGTLDRVLDLVFAPASAAGGTNVPALANLMTYRLDCRLSGLARSAGACIHATRMTLRFQATESSSGAWDGSSRMRLRSRWRKASP